MYSLDVFIGLDLAGIERRPSGIAILKKSEIIINTIYSDKEIITRILESKPIVVAIDAPLTLPLTSKIREVDRLMRKIGYKVLPPGFPGMLKLTIRGIKLRKILEKKGIQVIEIHPFSIIKALGFNNRSDFIKWISNKFKIYGILNIHTIDSIAAAYVALLHHYGKTFYVKAYDGFIVMPYNRLIFKNLNDICLSYHMKKHPLVAVDVVILTEKGIVLVKRLNEPFKDHWALPGGFVEYGETVERAAIREAKEETGLDVKLVGLVGVYSDPNRDPRGHVISITFLAEKVGGQLKAATDAKEVRVFSTIPSKLAFDHKIIIKDALELARKLGYKNLPKFED